MSATVLERRCQHRFYLMTCEDFRALEARAGGRCEICGRTEPLGIDHDHALGAWAVRGLLCQKCNVGLRLVDSGRQEPSADIARYLSDAWHLKNASVPTGIGQTLRRSIRIPDDEYEAVQEAAARNHETVSDVVRRALVAYVRRNK